MKNLKLLFILAFIIVFYNSCNLMRLKKEYYSETKVSINDYTQISIGFGGNSGIIEMSDKIVIIDTKITKSAEDFYNSILHLIKKKPVIIINTHLHHDHTGGNYLYNADTIYIGNYTNKMWNNAVTQENQINKLNYRKIKDIITIKDKNITLDIIPVGNGHTTNDIVVYYREEKLLFTGDLLFNKYHPFLDENNNTNPESWKNIIDSIINNYEIDIIIPGHGQITDLKSFKEQADYFNDIIETNNNSKKLREIRKKYKHFDNLPTLTSFKKTVKYIYK